MAQHRAFPKPLRDPTVSQESLESPFGSIFLNGETGQSAQPTAMDDEAHDGPTAGTFWRNL